MKLYITENIKYDISMPGISLLAPVRQKRIAVCTRSDAARQAFAAGALLYGILGVFRDDNIIVSPEGKPSLSVGKPCFSLSHGGDYTVLATDESGIGADIEKIREVNPAISKRFFTPEEAKYASDDKKFFEIWTRKESIVKADGGGIAGGFLSFSVCESPVFYRNSVYFVHTFEYNAHIISVSSLSGEKPEIIPVNPDRLLSKA